jgi:hypothetical protein
MIWIFWQVQSFYSDIAERVCQIMNKLTHQQLVFGTKISVSYSSRKKRLIIFGAAYRVKKKTSGQH